MRRTSGDRGTSPSPEWTGCARAAAGCPGYEARGFAIRRSSPPARHILDARSAAGEKERHTPENRNHRPDKFLPGAARFLLSPDPNPGGAVPRGSLRFLCLSSPSPAPSCLCHLEKIIPSTCTARPASATAVDPSGTACSHSRKPRLQCIYCDLPSSPWRSGQ